MSREITRKISVLDEKRNAREIVLLLTTYEFPWSIERALEFALFRTYAVPSISKILFETGEFIKRPRKRYDDTELILNEILENGFESERGAAALRRMNQMHARFSITHEDSLYVLSTFIFEPIRWLERFGWRPLEEKEKQAFYYYYTELGRYMNLKNIPEEYKSFEKFNLQYEKQYFVYAQSNHDVAASTRDLFLSFFLPKFMWPLGKPFIYAMIDEPMRKAFGFPKMPGFLTLFVQLGLKLRGFLLRFWPRRSKPHRFTQVKRPTYPEGYEIEELGTFGKRSR
jgi:hypothetical protein